MRLGIFVPSQTSGGNENLIYRVGEAWSNRGHENTVVYVTDGNKTSVRRDSRIELHAAGKNGFGAAQRFDLLEGGAFIDNLNLDLLLCPGNRVPRSHTKTVWWPQTVAPLDKNCMSAQKVDVSNRLRFAGIMKMLQASAQLADAAVFTSAYARGLYSGYFRRLQALPTVVVPPPFSIDPEAIIRKEVDVPSPFLLSASTFNRYKKIVETVEGYARSKSSGQYHLVLAGGFPEEDYHKEVLTAISDSGVSDQIHVLGHRSREELAWLYEHASAFIFASTTENAGAFALLDALAFGLPTASSQMSSMPEMNGQAVVPLDPTDPVSVAKAMDRVTDPDYAPTLARRAKQRANQSPTWEEAVEILFNFLIPLSERK